MRSIKELKKIKGKKVLVRVDFNVPLIDGKVESDFRIQKALPTINYLTKKGAKVVLITHLGKGEESLEPVAKVLNKYVKTKFVEDIIGDKATKTVNEMEDGDVVLLQNLRMDEGEKNKDKIFALSLSKYGDFYVNEAFPVSHREDASIVLLPKILPAYVGLQFEAEVKNLSSVFDKTTHPFLFILGGAKFSTKVPLIEKYLEKADHVFIGGAILNNLLDAKGYEVGKSLVDDSDYYFDSVLKNKKLILPSDLVVEHKGEFKNKKVDEVTSHEVIVDIGPISIESLGEVVKKSKMILWNGPLGKYENGGAKGTEGLLNLIAQSKAKSIIGGGDITAVISGMGNEDKFTFVSTGGGATLDFLAQGTLPGIEALR